MTNQREDHRSKDIGFVHQTSTFASRIDRFEVIGDFAETQAASTFTGTLPGRQSPAICLRGMDLKFTRPWRTAAHEWELTTRLVKLAATGTIDGKPIPAEHK
jgi:hypothetical protein